jgi:hypothetical protein
MSDLDRILTLARHGIDNDAQSQVPAERELKEVPVTKEAVGEFSQPLYDLQDELGLEDNILVDEMARWMDGQDITEFVENFRRHHEMPEGGHAEESVEAPAEEEIKTEQLSKKKKITNKTPVDMVAEEDLEEAQSPAQKAAFAKMLAAKNGEKEDAPVEEAKAKPDYADIDGDGDEKETMKKAAKDKEVKEETVTEAPTMDTTQLITLLKNAGLSEEAINKKLNEWANTPEGAAEQEATSHGEPYENFAQSVNISLKKYLDAEDYKVGIKEHTVKEISEAYKKFKGDPINEFDHYRDEEGNEVIATPGKDMPPVPPVPQVEPQEEVTMADIQGFLKIQDLVAKSNGAPTAVAVAPTPGMDVPEQPQPESPLDLKAKVQF